MLTLIPRDRTKLEKHLNDTIERAKVTAKLAAKMGELASLANTQFDGWKQCQTVEGREKKLDMIRQLNEKTCELGDLATSMLRLIVSDIEEIGGAR